LITGPEGTGKATLAYRLARFLLANTGKAEDLSVPHHDPTAKLINSGAHPDLITLERGVDEKKGKVLKNIPIEEVRKIAPFLHLTSSQGGWRIVVVDGADALNRGGGQQTLLKILEEPPERSMLILTAEVPGMLLPTIRSRCRVLKLEALAPEDLRQISEGFGLADVEEPVRDALIRMSQGSAARLMRYSRNEAHVLFQNWCEFLGDPMNSLRRLRLAEAWSSKSEEGITDTAMEVMFNWLQGVVRSKATGKTHLPILAAEQPLITRLYGRLKLESLLELWENLKEQQRQMESANLDARAVLLGMLDRTAETLAA
jgi:DNA polymerase-3 subunit delta'